MPESTSNQRGRCLADVKVIHAFLETTDANWRNSFYLECRGCKWERPESCGDMLFAPATNGRPVLLPVPDAERIFSRLIDRSECLGVMGNLSFLELYRKWFSYNPKKPPAACPLLTGACQSLPKLC